MDNPPAFPSIEEHPSYDMPMHYFGMSLRDYFAAHAPEPPPTWWGDFHTDCAGYAAWNYQYADAMLAQRKETSHDK